MQYKIFGRQHFLVQLSVGTIPHHKILHAIELLGTKVAPIVRRETGQAPASTEPAMNAQS
ncbi:MAG: hypothetical protein NVS4B7_21910 [Ktedonobacteraceae bacterium]